ncbi:MAG: sigma-70 family RNA polymerase sigma factor [Candidatus Poribacteria bacterium]|nr:sigma-70 family RNA polymerase sigma factor [Candidatus Poribacteria bacterium]
MEQKDAQLIQQVLQGDQEAFALLVNKYQKGVHALVWRKIGDFHIAQEITQDAFLRAYQKLETLKNHNLFGGWLYVIAARLCSDWFQKKSLPEQSLEVTDMNEVNRASYSRYVAQKQEAEADETRREVVKELLQKLPESERTVMTLHYLGEMTIKTISEFLGVSPNTVKSRLSRARNRLKKEENMIRQNLGSFQLPMQLTENIMREISRLAPTAPAANKPMGPWVLSAASAVLVFLLMGVGTQYLSRFQKPYNLNATSERTVELIEAAFVLDSPAKPAIRNQAGSSATPGKNPGAGQKPDTRLFAAALVDEAEVSTPKPQWIQTKGPEGASVNTLFTTTGGDIYAGTPTSLYKLSDDQRVWKLVSAEMETSRSVEDWITSGGQMVEHNDTLYVATDTEILTSTDSGSTWNSLGSHPKGAPAGLVITNTGFYLGLTEGVYHSQDRGSSWIALKNGLDVKRIHALAAVENTVFAGTDNGLYRLSTGTWDRVYIRPEGVSMEEPTIYALIVAEHRLYAAAGDAEMRSKSGMDNNAWWSLYRSTNSGDSWYSIDPWERLENEEQRNRKGRFPVGFGVDLEMFSKIKIVAAEERVMVVDANGELFYSINTGETWNSLDLKLGSDYNIAPPVLMLDKNTFYRGVPPGVQRTTDAGKSWHQFNTGFVDTTVTTLITIKGKLYANSMTGFVTSIDGGESWTPLPSGIDHGVFARGGIDHGVFVKAYDDSLYVKRGNQMNSLSPIARLSTEDTIPKFIPDMPAFAEVDPGNTVTIEIPPEVVMTALEAITGKSKEEIEALDPEQANEMLMGIDLNEALKDHIDLEQLKNEALNKALQEQPTAGMMSFYGDFAISGDTYYVEYQQRLFRWKPGMAAWYDTGVKDEAEPPSLSNLYSADYAEATDLMQSLGVKLAVSGKTLYVGKQDGHLMQSFDEGDTWNDVTADLPFSVAAYNTVVFAGSTVYVATDKGVAYSSDGTRWHKVTDAEGMPLVIEKFAVDGATVYGATERQVYELKENSSTWKQVTPEVPSAIISFTVDNNTLYVGTLGRGVLRFPLDKI